MADVTSEVRIVGSQEAGGLTLRTVGLAAGGLPELSVAGLPPYLGDGWARVLAALARRLAATGEVPDELAPGVRIPLEPAGDGTLTPVQPEGRDPADWRRDVLVRLFPEAHA